MMRRRRRKRKRSTRRSARGNVKPKIEKVTLDGILILPVPVI
jgi:hypothetical protein